MVSHTGVDAPSRIGGLARTLGLKPECFTDREAHYWSGLRQLQYLDRLIELARG